MRRARENDESFARSTFFQSIPSSLQPLPFPRPVCRRQAMGTMLTFKQNLYKGLPMKRTTKKKGFFAAAAAALVNRAELHTVTQSSIIHRKLNIPCITNIYCVITINL